MSSAKQQPLVSTCLNVKQRSRIQKRRLARQKLNAHLTINRDKETAHSESLLHPSRQEPNTGCAQRPQDSDHRSFTYTLERSLIKDMNTLAIGTLYPTDMSMEKTKL